MKRTLSLCLVVVMLLGMVAMTASATEAVAIDTYNISLGDDITINFNVTGLTPGQDYDVTMATDASETTYALTITGDDEGKAVVSFDELNPSMLATKVTVSIDGTEASLTKSVLDYCEWALGEMNNANELFTLVVDLMNYGAAAQAYLNEDATANASLTDLQKMFATAAPAVDAEYLYPETLDGAAIEWIGAAPLLGESVAYRYKFTVAEEYVASLAETEFVITVGEDSYIVSGADAENAGDYWFIVFTDLNPAQLLEDATIVAKNADNAVSGAWTFSAERYAAWALTLNNAKLTALVNSILSYAVAADAYTDDVANTNTIKVTEVTTVQAADKFDLYRKIMNLAGLEASVIGMANCGRAINAVYSAVGLDIVTNTTKDADGKYTGTPTNSTHIVPAVLGSACTNDKTSAKVLPQPGDANYNPYWAPMLVENSWGGTKVKINDTDHDYRNVDFQIGDIVCIRGTVSGTRYMTALYQGLNEAGEDSFIVSTGTSSDAYYAEMTLDTVWGLTFSGTTFTETAAEGGTTREVTTSGDAVSYFVIRPSQLVTVNNG